MDVNASTVEKNGATPPAAVVSAPESTPTEKGQDSSILLTADEYKTLQDYQAERNAIAINLGLLEEKKLEYLEALRASANNRGNFVKGLENKYHLPSGVRWGVDQATKKIVIQKEDPKVG